MDHVAHLPAGRTTTALHDRLLRFVHRLNTVQTLSLGVAVYLAWSIAVPTLFHVGTVWLLCFNTEGATFAATIGLARLLLVVEGRLRHQQLQLTTDLRQLSAREFEHVVGELYRLDGWQVTETGGHGEADGNVDLILRRGPESRLVQCKRWSSRDLGVDEVRKLGGALLREERSGVDGILVTASGYYPAAVAEAKEIGIELIDGSDLIARLENAGAEGLLQRPARTSWLCPECEEPMLLGRSAHGWWLRCPASGCRGKHDLATNDNRLVIDRLIAGA